LKTYKANISNSPKQAINLKKHLLIVAKYWLGGFTALMLLFYAIISIK
jgi:hypothetical protein